MFHSRHKKMITSTYTLLVVLTLLVTQCTSQRTPTITYISPPIVTRIGGTIEMDCSAIYATEYPILWVKLPSGCKIEREAFTNNIRSIISDNCTPIPLSSGSALIIRDNRFR
jgi:neuronal growth regulator 1